MHAIELGIVHTVDPVGIAILLRLLTLLCLLRLVGFLLLHISLLLLNSSEDVVAFDEFGVILSRPLLS